MPASGEIFAILTDDELIQLRKAVAQALVESDDPTLADVSANVPGLSLVRQLRMSTTEFLRELTATMRHRGILPNDTALGNSIPIDFRSRPSDRESDLTVTGRPNL